MKTFISILASAALLLLASTGSCLAQSPFQVFSVSGDVKLTATSTTRPLVKRDELKLSDQINVPQGGSLRIVDTSTGIVYNADKPGSRRVKQIIDAAGAASKTVIGAVNSQLVHEKSASGHTPGRVVGATSRGEDVELDLIVSKMLASPDKRLSIKEIPEGELMRLQILNESEATLPVAVFAVCEERRSVRSVLPEILLAAPGTTDLPEPLFAPDSEARLCVYEVSGFVHLPDLASALRDRLFK